MLKDEGPGGLKYAAGPLASALAAGEISALELFDDAVHRIERRDGPINAVVVRDFDRAREAAVAADRALARGERRPLLGVPMTVKEAHNVEGLPTTWGLESCAGWTASSDSVGVARLKAAGAIILGKTNVPPYLSDWQSANPVYGRTNNPHDLSRTPGGSSGGSAAALAAGLTPLEFGSDIGGSIRIPAAFCGVYGHKPSYNLVPGRGHAPPGLDGLDPVLGVVGPMARCASDLALALSVLAGPEGDEAKAYGLRLPPPRHAHLSDYRVLVIDSHPLAKADSEIQGALAGLAAGIEAVGAEVIFAHDRLPDLEASHRTYVTLLMTAMSRGAPPSHNLINAHAWLEALDAQLAIRRRWAEVFETVDVVLAPSLGVVAFKHMGGNWPDRRFIIDGEETSFGDQLAWPGMATVANLPATAAPVGRTAAGLPIGIQIIGPYLEDLTTIAFAEHIAAL